ncbi:MULTISPECIES: molybdopterin synthase catalytic subunit [Aphanothece]|uniref:molybdopterin synthase catalytic subunit n=1 Tax=Aphanothece TaxID=1121 RepID=UPI00398EE992
MEPLIALHPARFEPLALLQSWHELLARQSGGPAAAEASFVGRARGRGGHGEPLTGLELEHYPGMTERCLDSQARELMGEHGVIAVMVHHRVGLVEPGDAIVLVAVVADRRGPAQRCCQALLERLKHDAPFWKREHGLDGHSRWLAGNTAL